METKIVKLVQSEVKQIGQESDRTLRFVISNEKVDRDNDIVMLDGWDFADYIKNPVFLWCHNYWELPVGKAVGIEKDTMSRNLYMDVKFSSIDELCSDPKNPSEEALFADTVYNAYKNGYLNATSVGFKGEDYEVREDEDSMMMERWERGRLFKRQTLIEVSAVPVPANADALIQARSMKTMKPEYIDILEKVFGSKATDKTKKTKDEVEEMKPEEIKAMIDESISKAIGAVKEEFKAIQEIITESKEKLESKTGAKLSKATLARLAKAMEHAGACMTELKELSDSGVTETDPDSDSGVEDYPKGINPEEIDFSKYGIE